MDQSLSVKIALWVNRILFALICVLVALVPWLVEVYSGMRLLSSAARTAIIVCFYCCVPVVTAALFAIEKMLKNILNKQVFISKNVGYIRCIRWCCAGVCLICIPAACFYQPLVFPVLIMGFLSLMINVVCQVFKAAVVLREENDLTI